MAAHGCTRARALWLAYLACARLAVPAAAFAPAPLSPAAANGDGGSFIVVWRAGVDGAAIARRVCAQLAAEAAAAGGAAGAAAPPAPPAPAPPCAVEHNSLINAMAGRFSPSQLAAVRAEYKASVDYVAADHALGLSDDVPQRRQLPEELNATWGLDVLDQPAAGGGAPALDGRYGWAADADGTGVTVYVLDTGVRASHDEFARPDGTSRAAAAFDAVTPGGDADDCHSHGTHVAATIGGRTYGVAKNVSLRAVRVLDCAGRSQVSTMLRALEWVARDRDAAAAAAAAAGGGGSSGAAVVHMSIEGAYSAPVNAAVEGLVRGRGLVAVAAAGNTGSDACRCSPGSAPDALTVAAVDSELRRWAYGNHGPCVDVFAPGVAIRSAGIESDAATATKTGTSMAAPFVTGVVAGYLQAHGGASPDEVAGRLLAAALPGRVRDDSIGFATLRAPAGGGGKCGGGGGAAPGAVDISSTPNRLLRAGLRGELLLSPAVVRVGAGAAPVRVSVALTRRPAGRVVVSVTAPAAWDGRPIAEARPAQLEFLPTPALQLPLAGAGGALDDGGQGGEGGGGLGGGGGEGDGPPPPPPQELVLVPRADACEGDYFVELRLRAAAAAGDAADGAGGGGGEPPALHTVRVVDARPPTGDDASMPRVVPGLPFADSQDTGRFTHGYSCTANNTAPDVFYSFTPARDMDVAMSTCGSQFDTMLALFEADGAGGAGGGGATCNDDDRGCASNTANSRIDAALQGGRTYLIVVDGYAGTSGLYTLSVACTSCAPGAGWEPAAAPGNVTGDGGGAGGGGGGGAGGGQEPAVQLPGGATSRGDNATQAAV